jgi:hypothetical protein
MVRFTSPARHSSFTDFRSREGDIGKTVLREALSDKGFLSTLPSLPSFIDKIIALQLTHLGLSLCKVQVTGSLEGVGFEGFYRLAIDVTTKATGKVSLPIP